MSVRNNKVARTATTRYAAAIVTLCAISIIAACEESSICANGTAAPGTSAEQCASCDTGYHLEASLCQANAYSCENGIPASGAPDTDGEARCATCDANYHLEEPLCKVNAHACANGTAAPGIPVVHNTERCASCEAGYHPEETLCKVDAYACANGTAASGTPAVHNTERCASCEAGHLLINNNCRACLPGESQMATDTNIVLTETVSDSAITFTCTTTGAAGLTFRSAQMFFGNQLIISVLRDVGFTDTSASHPFFGVTLTAKSGSGTSQVLTATETVSVSELTENNIDLDTTTLTCVHSDSGAEATLTLCTE